MAIPYKLYSRLATSLVELRTKPGPETDAVLLADEQECNWPKLQPRYVGDEFVLADALEYVAAHGQEFDAIHASPPCQAYTTLGNIHGRRSGHVDLIANVREALIATGKLYVIENVQGAPLITQFRICGHSLGMRQIARHRHFESNVIIFAPKCTHRYKTGLIGIYGDRPDGHRVSRKQYRLSVTASSIDEAREAMGIDWMDWSEIKEAIPPAYTEFIGRQIISILTR